MHAKMSLVNAKMEMARNKWQKYKRVQKDIEEPQQKIIKNKIIPEESTTQNDIEELFSDSKPKKEA